MRSADTRSGSLRLVAGLAAGLAGGILPAFATDDATPAPAATVAEKNDDPDSLLLGNGVVGIMRRHALSLSLRPHFGDLVNRDHLGVSAQARYGIAENWELSARVNAHVGHGFGDAPAFSDPGVGEIQVGARHRLISQPEHAVGVVAGLGYSRPVGRPPAEMADAYSHIAPFVVVSRRLPSRPEWTVYTRFGLDFVSLETPSALDSSDLTTEDSWVLAPGVNRERGDWSWTLDAHLVSSAGLSSNHEYRIGLSPSVNWRLPERFTPTRKGRWVLGLGLSASYDGSETDFGVRGSLRTDFTLRELFRKAASRPPP